VRQISEEPLLARSLTDIEILSTLTHSCLHSRAFNLYGGLESEDLLLLVTYRSLYVIQGRLNQSARAQAPDFFLIEGPPTGCGEIIFLTNYFITFAKINCKGNPVNTF